MLCADLEPVSGTRRKKWFQVTLELSSLTSRHARLERGNHNRRDALLPTLPLQPVSGTQASQRGSRVSTPLQSRPETRRGLSLCHPEPPVAGSPAVASMLPSCGFASLAPVFLPGPLNPLASARCALGRGGHWAEPVAGSPPEPTSEVSPPPALPLGVSPSGSNAPCNVGFREAGRPIRPISLRSPSAGW